MSVSNVGNFHRHLAGGIERLCSLSDDTAFALADLLEARRLAMLASKLERPIAVVLGGEGKGAAVVGRL